MDDESILSRISLLDVINTDLDARILEGIKIGAVNPDRFKQCFSQFDDVLVEIMKIAGVLEMGYLQDARARDYAMGRADMAKTILTLATLKGDLFHETDIDIQPPTNLE